MTDNNEHLNDGLAMAAGSQKLTKKDEYHALINLINHVNSFEPRDRWILPILRGRECQDFQNQLFTAIEDYERK